MIELSPKMKQFLDFTKTRARNHAPTCRCSDRQSCPRCQTPDADGKVLWKFFFEAFAEAEAAKGANVDPRYKNPKTVREAIAESSSRGHR